MFWKDGGYQAPDDKTFAMHFANVAQQYRDGAIDAIEAIANMACVMRDDDMYNKLDRT